METANPNSNQDPASAAMERYADGDEVAFGILYEHLAPRLYAYLLKRTRDPVRAEDLLQQTFLHVHRARGTFICGSDVVPWVLAIARRLVIDGARSSRHQPLLAEDDWQHVDIEADAEAADDLLRRQQAAVRLERTFERLPEPQRVAFDLVKQKGMSLAQAAESLRISIGAVKLRMHRAQVAMRAALFPEEETIP